MKRSSSNSDNNGATKKRSSSNSGNNGATTDRRVHPRIDSFFLPRRDASTRSGVPVQSDIRNFFTQRSDETLHDDPIAEVSMETDESIILDDNCESDSHSDEQMELASVDEPHNNLQLGFQALFSDSFERAVPNQVRSMNLTTNVIAPGCDNERLRSMAYTAAREIISKMIEYNAFRCPLNKLTRGKLKPLDIYSSVHQIYAILDQNNPNIIEKVGCSGNSRDRYSTKDPTMLERTVILVSQNNISLELDTILVSIVDKLLDDICRDKSLPPDFRRLCHTIQHRGGDALGLKRPLYLQLIEIGSELRYGLHPIAEVFRTGEKKQEQRRKDVLKVYQTWISTEADDLSAFVGKVIQMVDTWATGQSEELLSSQACANDYVASGIKWVDVLMSIYQNTSDPAKIYATDFTDDEIRKGRQFVVQKIKETIDNDGVLFIAKNEEKLFPNNGLVKELEENYGFDVKFRINDGRITSLTRTRKHGKETKKAKVIVYSPLGFAMDSRLINTNNLNIKLRTFLEMGVLKRVVCYLLDQPIPPMIAPENEPDCITAAYFFQSIVDNFHFFDMYAAAVARDALTADNVFACKQNNLAKVSEDHGGHISTKARSMTWYDPPKRPLEKDVIGRGVNRLSMATRETLKSTLQEINRLFSRPSPSGKAPSSQTVGVRWKSLLNQIVCPEFREECQHIIHENIKENVGNQSTYERKKNIKNNDELLRDLWDGQRFAIQLKQPAENSPEAKFDPCNSKYKDLYKPFVIVPPENFVKDGLKERLSDRQKQGNTNHEKACKMNGKRKMHRPLGKIYAFLDDSRKPQFQWGRASDKGPKGTITLVITKLIAR